MYRVLYVAVLGIEPRVMGNDQLRFGRCAKRSVVYFDTWYWYRQRIKLDVCTQRQTQAKP